QLMWLSGYADRKSPAEGTLHPLFARALALEDPAGHRAVLVALDLVGVPRPLSLDVCADLEKQYGLRREGIVLASSHTPSAPPASSKAPSITPSPCWPFTTPTGSACGPSPSATPATRPSSMACAGRAITPAAPRSIWSKTTLGRWPCSGPAAAATKTPCP